MREAHVNQPVTATCLYSSVYSLLHDFIIHIDAATSLGIRGALYKSDGPVIC